MEACIPGAAPPPPHPRLTPLFFYVIKLLNKTTDMPTILTLTSRKKREDLKGMRWVRYWGRCIGLGVLGLGRVYSGAKIVAHSRHTHMPSGFIVTFLDLQWTHFLAMYVFSSLCLMICFLSVHRICLQVQTHRTWLTGIISPVRKVPRGKTCKVLSRGRLGVRGTPCRPPAVSLWRTSGGGLAVV